VSGLSWETRFGRSSSRKESTLKNSERGLPSTRNLRWLVRVSPGRMSFFSFVKHESMASGGVVWVEIVPWDRSFCAKSHMNMVSSLSKIGFFLLMECGVGRVLFSQGRGHPLMILSANSLFMCSSSVQ